MSLIRRRKTPSPPERAFGVVRLGLKGLVAQRVARRAFKGYKLARKLPLLIGVGVVGVIVAKKLSSGGGGQSDAPSPAPAPTPAAPKTEAPKASTSAPVAVPDADEAPKIEAEPDGAPGPELTPEPEGGGPTPDLGDVVASEATVPAHPASAGTGGAQGDGVPTDEESAEASGESSDAAPPKD